MTPEVKAAVERLKAFMFSSDPNYPYPNGMGEIIDIDVIITALEEAEANYANTSSDLLAEKRISDSLYLNVGTLEAKVEAMKSERDLYNERCDELRVKVVELEAKIASFNVTAETLTTINEEVSEERSALRVRVKELESKIEAMRKAGDDLDDFCGDPEYTNAWKEASR